MAIQQKDIQSMLLVVYSISLLLVEKVICSVKIQIFVFIKKKSHYWEKMLSKLESQKHSLSFTAKRMQRSQEGSVSCPTQLF